MGTLASNRKGFIVGTSGGNYEEALAATSGTVVDQATGNQVGMQYFASTGRGGGTFRFIRTFIHFNTSGISAANAEAPFNLVLTSSAGNSSNSNNNITAVKHSAGSSNGSALSSGDFDNLDRNTLYSETIAYPSSGSVSVTLNAAAANQIINESNFNIALLLSFDASASEESPIEEDGDITNGIAFSSAISLTYIDVGAGGYGHKVLTVASGSIGKVSTVATANIGKINTVD